MDVRNTLLKHTLLHPDGTKKNNNLQFLEVYWANYVRYDINPKIKRKAVIFTAQSCDL
jgi:hypothetical protein